MKNTLHFTLINTFILLILFSLNVKADTISDKVSACNQAIEKGEFKASLNLANEILNLEKILKRNEETIINDDFVIPSKYFYFFKQILFKTNP
jgi:hypothetical protein